MAKVSKRSWTTTSGEKKGAWLLTYHDAQGTRHRIQFSKKSEADAERIHVEGQIVSGTHVADKNSLTVLDAAMAFLADFENLVRTGKRERSTFQAYRHQVNLHLRPHGIAGIKLSRLSGPDCTNYARALESSLSDAMATRVFSLLRHILKFSQGNGWIAGNPATGVAVRTTGKRGNEGEKPTIPPKPQLKALLAAAQRFDNTGRATALVSLLIFGGLRASELRGLRRKDLRLADGKVDIRQRADQWNVIGPCKTKNSRRSIPLPPSTIAALRAWLPHAPTSEDGLVFPNGAGKPESYANLYHRLWTPLMASAGLADQDKRGKVTPWFALHALRHVACSLWIEQAVPAKKIQAWAGHASIQFTLDRYGHLWSDDTSDQAIVRSVEQALAISGT